MSADSTSPKWTCGTSYDGCALVLGMGWFWRMEPAQSPLEMIYQDIERAIQARLWYLAIAVTLSLPDVCAALECEPGKAWVTEAKYVAWFESNAASQFHF